MVATTVSPCPEDGEVASGVAPTGEMVVDSPLGSTVLIGVVIPVGKVIALCPLE